MAILMIAIAILAYYFGRIQLLKFVYNIKGSSRVAQSASMGGFIISVLTEVLWWWVIAPLLFANAMSCDSGGDFSSCGWGLIIVVILGAVSIIAMFIGMAAGAIYGFKKQSKLEFQT